MSCKVLLLRQLVSSQRMFITKYLAIVKLKNIFIFRKDKKIFLHVPFTFNHINQLFPVFKLYGF